MISLEDASFSYADGTAGVSGIDLRVRPGECVVLTGPSGGGKTTLIRLLNGLAPGCYPGALSGSVSLCGRAAVSFAAWEVGRMVGSVFQDPASQFFSADLAGEVAFACENYGFASEEVRARTDASIRTFDLDSLRTRPLDALSSGEKQRVAVASVYALRPGAYVCDEPTANLDEEGVFQLAAVLMRLKKEGAALVVAEHRLSWLEGLADRFLYVRGGRVLWEKTPDELGDMAEDERVRWGLRALRPEPRRELAPPAGARAPDQSTSLGVHAELAPPAGARAPAIEARGLHVRRAGASILEGVSLAFWHGHVAALVGRNGAGKSSLAMVLSGVRRESGGDVLINGTRMGPRARRERVWYGANDTGTQFFTDSVEEEVLLGVPRTAETLQRARALLKRLGLYDRRESHPATLSGGQKQRLSIACGFMSGREVLVFDEPTSGLDGENMRIVASAFRQAAADGKAVLVITHDTELVNLCCSHLVEVG